MCAIHLFVLLMCVFICTMCVRNKDNNNNNVECHLHMFDKDRIAKAIFDMKTDIRDDFDGLLSDYFKEDTDLLYVYIYILFVQVYISSVCVCLL